MNLFEKSQELESIVTSKPVNKSKLHIEKLQNNYSKVKFRLTEFLWPLKKVPEYFLYEHPKNMQKRKDQIKVLYCIDGDTFVAMYNNESTSFRLASINTPEKGMNWGKEATLMLAHLIEGKNIYVKVFGSDKYNRKVVDIFLDPDHKFCVNDIMIKEGMTNFINYNNANKFHTHNFIQNAFKSYYAFSANYQSKGIWGRKDEFYDNLSYVKKPKI